MNVGITAFTDKGAVAASTSVTHPSVIQSWPPPLLTQSIGFSDSDAARRRRRACWANAGTSALAAGRNYLGRCFQQRLAPADAGGFALIQIRWECSQVGR